MIARDGERLSLEGLLCGIIMPEGAFDAAVRQPILEVAREALANNHDAVRKAAWDMYQHFNPEAGKARHWPQRRSRRRLQTSTLAHLALNARRL